MNYTLDDIPDSGKNPIIWMDIFIKDEFIGRINIRLFREVFPAGVENFIRIATGQTFRTELKGKGNHTFVRQVRRTYDGSRFFNFSHNNYIVSGDIYSNTGISAGTIYNDEPIPATLFGSAYYEHAMRGLISLVPFRDSETDELFYDSTFMITLDMPKDSNVLQALNSDQIVIGQIIEGLEIIDKINILLFPFAGRKYPELIIGRAGLNSGCKLNRKNRPVSRSRNRNLLFNI